MITHNPTVATATTAWPWPSEPVQPQRIALITGANSGIGFETARALAQHGYSVIMAARDRERGANAIAALRNGNPSADLELLELDLADFQSVHRAAEYIVRRFDRLDLLINNAGIMAPPLLRTNDGHELQFGVNHLGHFALTGLLMPLLMGTPAARVVTVSSGAHRFVQFDFDNLDGSKGYERWSFYGRSKLANLLFTAELQRRLQLSQSDVLALSCHPGYAATNLQRSGLELDGRSLMVRGTDWMNRLFAQSAADGALPTLYAATATPLAGGSFIGPAGIFGMRGQPTLTQAAARAYDTDTAQRLWQISTTLTGVHFPLLGD